MIGKELEVSGNMGVTLELPYPPTVNTYWRNVNGRMVMSKKGREYRALVARIFAGRCHPLAGRLSLSLEAYMPDKRIRDIDNLGKASIDALTHAGAWLDDEQIDELIIRRAGYADGGKLVVAYREI